MEQLTKDEAPSGLHTQSATSKSAHPSLNGSKSNATSIQKSLQHEQIINPGRLGAKYLLRFKSGAYRDPRKSSMHGDALSLVAHKFAAFRSIKGYNQ